MVLFERYKTFIKYIAVALLSFIIDIALFTLFNNYIIREIIISTILARIISSFINYLLNKNRVFNNNKDYKSTIIKYYILVVIQMLISALLVKYVYSIFKINATIIKIPVEFIIFICNYLIQKLIVFKNKD